MTRVRRNYFVGIRVPWTLANEEVWDKTHRFASPLWILAGLVTTAGAFAGPTIGFIILLVAIGLAGIVPTVYSYRLYNKLTKLL